VAGAVMGDGDGEEGVMAGVGWQAVLRNAVAARQ